MADPSNSTMSAATAPNLPADEPKLEVQVKKSWVDESEEEDEKAADELFQSVSMNDPEFLEDPDVSNIEAVTDTPYSSAKKFEDPNLSEELIKGLKVEMEFVRPSKQARLTRRCIRIIRTRPRV